MWKKYYTKLIFLFVIIFIQGCNKDEINDPFLINDTGTFADERDESTYSWVRIGEQIWMSENLAYLPSVSSPKNESQTDPYYYVYGYSGTDSNEAIETDNYKTYGVLYNWPAAKSACPNGWHLPSDDEWEQLAQYINEQKGPYNNSNGYWYDLGIHLKASNSWKKNDGSDDFGFKALPGGYRSGFGFFESIGQFGYGFWWCSTEKDNANENSAWCRDLGYYNNKLRRYGFVKETGLSVRCLKN